MSSAHSSFGGRMGALAMFGSGSREAVGHGHAEGGIAESLECVVKDRLASKGDFVGVDPGEVAVHVAPRVANSCARCEGEEAFMVSEAEKDCIFTVPGVGGGVVYGGDVG